MSGYPMEFLGPTKPVELSFDIVLVSGDGTADTKISVVTEDPKIKNPSLSDSHSQQLKLRKARIETDQSYQPQSVLVTEFMFTNYTVIAQQMKFERLYETRVDHTSLIVLQRQGKFFATINFCNLLFYKKQTTVDSLLQAEVEVCLEKIDTPTNKPTYCLVLNRPDISKKILTQLGETPEEIPLSASQKANMVQNLATSRSARDQIAREMLHRCQGVKAITPVLLAIIGVSKKYLLVDPDLDREFLLRQQANWDLVVKNFFSLLLIHEDVPQEGMDEPRAADTQEALREAVQMIHPFSVIDLKDFFTESKLLLQILLPTDGFLRWLLLNNISLTHQDVNLLISNSQGESNVQGIVKFASFKKYSSLVIGFDCRTRVKFLCKISDTYIREENSSKKVQQFLYYFQDEIQGYSRELTPYIGEDTMLRTEIMNCACNLLEKCVRSPLQHQSISIVQNFIVNDLLSSYKGFVFEFYELVFTHRALMVLPLIHYCFGNYFMNSQEKLTIFEQCFLPANTGAITPEVCSFISDMIKGSRTANQRNSQFPFTLAQIFEKLDSRFPLVQGPGLQRQNSRQAVVADGADRNVQTFEEFIHSLVVKNNLSEFMSCILVAVDQTIFLNSNPDALTLLAGSRIMSCLHAIKNFLRDLRTHCTLEALLGNRCFAQPVEELLESLNEDEYNPFKLQITKLKNEALHIYRLLRISIRVLEDDRSFLSKFSFYDSVCQAVRKLNEDRDKLTLPQAQARPEYREICNKISEPSIQDLARVRVVYPKFHQVIKERLDFKSDLNQFYDSLVRIINEFRGKLDRIKNPKECTLALVHEFVPDHPMSPTPSAQHFLVWDYFQIDQATRAKIADTTRVVREFIKLCRQAPAITKVSRGPILQLTTNSVCKKIIDTYEAANDEYRKMKLNPIIANPLYPEMTIALLEKVDSNALVRKPASMDKFVVSLPRLLEVLTKSPELMNFIKTNGDKFIKSMREEVDNENIEIVNKIDAINKNLRFVFSETTIVSLVDKLNQIPAEEQDKLCSYMESIEGLVKTHISFLADKTKKDAGYSNQLIGQLLSGCQYIFEYSTTERGYQVAAHYGRGTDIKVSVSAQELSEQLNKSIIIVSEKGAANSSNLQGMDEYAQRIVKFSEVGKYLLKIKKILKQLKDLGVINQHFQPIVYLLPSSSKAEMSNVDPNSKKLFVDYNRESGQTDLQAFISSLEYLTFGFDKILRAAYTKDSALMTHFHGRYLYHLTEFLRGREFAESQTAQLTCLLTESHLAEGFTTVDFSAARNPLLDESTPEEVLKNVQSVAKQWTKEVITRRNFNSNRVDNFFAAKKVLLVKKSTNVFNTILKILKDCECAKPGLSQFLFCTSTSTPQEVLAFAKRALMDKGGRPHFVINLHLTGFSGVAEFRKAFETLGEDEWIDSNPRIVAFYDEDSATRELDDCPFMLDAGQFLQRLHDTVTDEEVRKLFAESISKLQLVVSDVSGMGKTTYIKKSCGSEFQTVEIFLAGEMNETTIEKRLRNTTEQFMEHKGRGHNLVIKLDFIEDFQRNKEHVDFILMNLCFLHKYYTDYGCFEFGSSLKGVFIEIGNTFASELFANLSLLQFLGRTEGCVQRIKPFSIQDINFPSDSQSPEHQVCKFLLAVDARVDKFEVSENIQKSTFLQLMQKHFYDRVDRLGEAKNLTFSRYQYWIKVINHLVTELKAGQSVFGTYKLLSTVDQKNLFIEISEEVLDFATSVIGLSAQQIKVSQDQMKDIMSTIDKHKLRADAIEKYQNSVKNLINTWSTKEMLIPLAIKSKILFAVANVEMFKEGYKRHMQRTALKTLIIDKEKPMWIDPENLKANLTQTEAYLHLLCNVTQKDFKAVVAQSKEFRKTGFTLTAENYMKICLILLKAELKIPIIMMGESGCGKTYLSHYVAECLLGETLKDLTLYSGVTEEDFVNFMTDVIKVAKEKAPQRVWVLFDEFNTSCLQSIVAEIMIDRVCSINKTVYEIPDNLVFLACCNPYRMKSKMANVGLASKTSNLVLSHRVYPIPERLIDYVWDFGQLTDDDEKSILSGIVRAEKLFDPKTQAMLESNFCTVLSFSHQFVRNIEERSGVSLRDVKRILIMYRWFLQTVQMVAPLVAEPDIKDLNGQMYWAIVCAVMVCYGLRLNGQESQEDFFKKLVGKVNLLLVQNKGYKKGDMPGILSRVSDFFLGELKKYEGSGILGEGTALNKPLKENFITMLACFETTTPMIICGAPGTSKTLSTHILNSTLVPYIMKKYKLFGIFKKGINPIYYGGSETSTSEGISYVFSRGEKYIKDGADDKPVVIFDEIGLAELSPYNPLKILHPLLEKPGMTVGFIGLSNWTLDLSKMNRMIYVSRPDMEIQDLQEIFESCLNVGNNELLRRFLKKYLNVLSKTFLKFRRWQKDYSYHPNFHGSRDIYSVAKYFYTSLSDLASGSLKGLEAGLNNLPEERIATNLVKIGIERNFGGTVYEFSFDGNMGSGEIPITSIPKLDSERIHAIEKTSELVKNQKMGDIYERQGVPTLNKKLSQNQDEELQLRKALSSVDSVYFSSAQVFKRLFLNELENEFIKDSSFNSGFMASFSVFDLINSSLLDQNARFMLVRSEGEIVENILIERIRSSLPDNKIVDWRGVAKRESNVELFSNIKSYISLGYFVIMKNIDELYGSLYDLFNQKFMDVEGRKYCYLYFGESKHRVEIHPDFNCAILIDANDGRQTTDIELSQPAPFLNRFEKYLLKVADVFPGKKLEELFQVRDLAKEMADGKTNYAVALNMDMISSICISCKKQEGNDGAVSVPQERSNGFVQYPEHMRLIYRLSTLNYILKPDLAEEEISLLRSEHKYNSLSAVLGEVKRSSNFKMCLFTFSNPIEVESMRQNLQDAFGVTPIKSDELIEYGLESRTRLIRSYTNEFLFLQFISPDHLVLMTQMKASMSENPLIKKGLFLVHLDKISVRRDILKQSVGLNYWADWDNQVLDNLRHTDYDKVIKMRDFTLEELIVDDKSRMMRTVVQDIVITSFQKLAQEKGELSTKMHLQEIRKSIDRDVDDIFISSVRKILKDLQIIDKKSRWMELVEKKRRNIQNMDYIDFEKEIFDVVMDLYSDKIKRIVGKVNAHLKNYPGYTYGLLSKDPQVVSVYQNKLKESLDNLRLGANDLLKPRPSQDSFFRVPFLGESYEEFMSEITQQVFEANRSTLVNLYTYTHKLAVAKSKQKDDAETKNLLKLVIDGEDFLAKKCREIILPILEKSGADLRQSIAEGHFNALIRQDLLVKLLSLPRFRYAVMIRDTGLLMQLCEVINPRLSNKTEDSFESIIEYVTAAVYLLGAVSEEVKILLELVTKSNVNMEKITALVAEIHKKTDTYSGSRFNLAKINEFTLSVQQSLVPSLDTKTIVDLRLSLETTVDSISKINSVRLKDMANLNFKSLAIALSLVEILPERLGQSFLNNLEHSRLSFEAYGSQISFKTISKVVERIFMDHYANIEDKRRYNLLLGEYIRLCASFEIYDFYNSSVFDAIMEKVNDSQIMDNLAAIVGHSLQHLFPAFWSVEAMKATVNKISSSNELSRAETFLKNLKVFEPKHISSLVHLVDALYLRSVSDNSIALDPVSEIKYLVEQLKLAYVACPSFQSVQGVVLIVMLRKILSFDSVKTILGQDNLRRALDKELDDALLTKEDFFANCKAPLLCYFMQRIERISGDIESFAGSMVSVRIALDLINSTGDTSIMIVGYNQEFCKNMNMLNESLHVEINKGNTQEIRKLVNTQIQGSDLLTKYAIGINLINRFVVMVKNESQSTIIKVVREAYLDNLLKSEIAGNLKKVYEFILGDKLCSLTPLIPSPQNSAPKVQLKFRKTVYHMLLLMALFPTLGYSFEKGETVTKSGIPTSKLQCKLSTSENLSNFTSIFANIIKERLGDGSYQDYGAGMGRNLGVYQCSCKLIYSIGNCGYAMVKTQCPRCGKEIGGSNHQSVQREGHKHIQTLDEFHKIILAEYELNDKTYKVHPAMSVNSTEFIAHALKNIPLKIYIDNRNKEKAPENLNHQNSLAIAHLMDHVYFYVAGDLTGTSQDGVLDTMTGVLNLKSKANMDLLGKIEGKYIETAQEYLSYHVSNDLGQLQAWISRTNLSETLDFVNAALSQAAKSLSTDASTSTIIPPTSVANPVEMLKVYEELKGSQLTEQDEQNTLIRTIIAKKAQMEKVRRMTFQDQKGLLKDQRMTVVNLYPLMRHTTFERSALLDAFKTRLDTSPHSFLKSVVKYQAVLGDFARMVTANLDMAIYLNNNYNRVFTFDEATKLDITRLEDPQLQELFKEFRSVWTSVIPKHEDTNPEVFSFAFMCNQDLNVARYIEQTLSPGGALLINFLMVDSGEEFAGKETLYMKGIIRTFLEGFHNKLMNQAKKVLKAEEALSKKKITIEYISKEDLVAPVDFESVVLDNMRVNSDITNENEVFFDLERIEYTLAKEFIKAEIIVEENDLKFFNFKNSRVSESEQILRGLSNKIPSIPLSKEILESVEDSDENEVEASMRFTMEIGEYVSQNFLFADSNRLVSDLMKTNTNTNLARRFAQYNPAKHGLLKLGHLSEYFSLLSSRNFKNQLTKHKRLYSKALTSAQKEALSSELMGLDTTTLEKLKTNMQASLQDNFYQKQFGEQMIGQFLDADTVGASVEALDTISFSCYFPVCELIDDVLYEVNKRNKH